MNPANDKILVRVDLSQKQTVKVAGVEVRCAYDFGTNYREKSPVVAEVVKGNVWVKPGDILLCHHNHFYAPSPYHVQDDLFAIPSGGTVFAIVKPTGELLPLYGNIICETLNVDTMLPIPPDHEKKHLTKALVKDGAYSGYKSGDLIFHRPSAWYEIVYHWGDVEKRVIKVHEDQICGVIRSWKSG